MGLVAELQRRNVIRMAGLYLVGAWLVVQVASTLLPMFEAPAWVPRAVVIALSVLFLPAMLLAWIYEFTPEGLKRESEVDRSAPSAQGAARRIEHGLVLLLALGLAYFAFDKFVLAPRQQAAALEQARKAVIADARVQAVADKSIAVLPFLNMSADKEQEYFADGIAEELLNRLAKVEGLRVIARTSSFSFKGKDADIATIAAALKVANVLEGSVRRSGDKLRISAKLIRTADGSELWSETYDRQLADVFAMQDDIAGSVVGQLQLTLLGQPQATKGANAEAYALYLQGRQIRFQRTRAALGQAHALMQQALQLDPGLAAAWAELSTIYRGQADISMRPNAEGYALAREAAEKALSLDPKLAAAHVELSVITRGNLDLAGAAEHLSRAAASAPRDAGVLRGMASLARALGREDQALAYARAAVANDPQSPGAHVELASAYQAAGRWQDSLAAYRRAIALSPDYTTAHDAISDNLVALGRPQEALAEAQLEEAGLWRFIALAKAYHALGMKAESDAALAGAIRDYSRDGPWNIAYVYAVRGENDKAFEWLERALEERDPGLSEIASSIYVVKLHDDPRWLPFLRKIGYAPEQLAAIRLGVPPLASPAP